MSTAKQVRAMKARRSSTIACGHFVLRGQLIVCYGWHRWVCGPCALNFRRQDKEAA